MWYLVIGMIVMPFVLVFLHGFVNGLRGGIQTGSGRPAPAVEPSRERPGDWWILGRTGDRRRTQANGG